MKLYSFENQSNVWTFRLYVTVAFHVGDDMKSSVDKNVSGDLKFGGTRLGKLYTANKKRSTSFINPPQINCFN